MDSAEHGSTEWFVSLRKGESFQGLHPHDHRKGDLLVDIEHETKRLQAKRKIVYVWDIYASYTRDLMECSTPQ